MKFLKFKDRPAHTLLFIAEEKCYRMDFDKDGAALTELQEAAGGCADPFRLAACIAAALAATGTPGNKTWVLFGRLPVQWLTLPAMQVIGVKNELLLQALQFELEGITGQSMQGFRLGQHLLESQDGLNQYWLAYIDGLAFEDMLTALRKAGSRLGGLLHPGGLPLCIGQPEQTAWWRIEAWREQLVVLAATDTRFEIQNISLDSRNWRNALEKWRQQAPAQQANEALLYNDINILPDTQRIVNLTVDDDIAAWLGLWAQQLLRQQTPAVPLLTPLPLFDRELALRVVSGGGVLMLCMAHLLWNLYQANHHQAETDALKKTEQAMQGLRKKITAQQEEQLKLQEKLTQLQGDSQAIPKTLAVLQQRPALLLAALAKGHPDGLVLESIEIDKDTVTVKGVALQAAQPNQLGTQLADQLQQSHWQVEAPTKEDMRLFEQGGPWSFALSLTDQGIPGFSATQDKPKTVKGKQQ